MFEIDRQKNKQNISYNILMCITYLRIYLVNRLLSVGVHVFLAFKIQCREKVFAPFLFFLFFAYLSHLKDSDHQTNFNITQK